MSHQKKIKKLILDWRLYVRTKRILSERAQAQAQEQLRKDQANQTKKLKYATLIGHIGKTYVYIVIKCIN